MHIIVHMIRFFKDCRVYTVHYIIVCYKFYKSLKLSCVYTSSHIIILCYESFKIHLKAF